MNDGGARKPDYGNWVSIRLLVVPGILCIIFAGASLVLPLLAIAAFLFLFCFGYFAYARYVFSPKGRDLQNKIQALVMDSLQWDGKGKVIDIGCGSASLTIRIALNYPNAEITGIDNWGGRFEYSADKCRRNAEIEGVSTRTSFLRASASAIPASDETYDLAVNNLTFHEVHDVKDKRDLIKEALRVLKKDGSFVFQDLFLWKRVYGDVGELLDAMKGWGVKHVTFVPTNDNEFIPRALKLPFMVGTTGIIYGKK
ncbi:MAG: class I SAM-dependent methyltransferase [Spirochaetes bacterium]|nr:class I SAM-dependent methyltransferase [Spirochaetota bacterium]